MGLIDKKKLMEELFNADAGRYYAFALPLVLSIVRDQPTIEAEPVKHGRWKPFDLTWGRSIYACTNCGEAFEVPTEGDKPMYDYCPYCGADMRGEKDD